MRYLGNKTRISKYIIPFLIKHLDGTNLYIEPFAGAMGVISNIEYPYRIANDKDKYIICLMKAIVDGWIPPSSITQEQYQDIKDNYLNFPPHLVGFIAYGCSFGGKWFAGLARGGKTSKGIPRNHVAESSRNLQRLRPKLQNIEFSIDDYRNLPVRRNCVIYCDPPYENTTAYKSNFDHETFWHWVRLESLRNYVYVSEYNAPEDFIPIWEKEHKTGIDHAMTSHKKTVEKLFVHENYYNKNC